MSFVILGKNNSTENHTIEDWVQESDLKKELLKKSISLYWKTML